MPRLPIGHQIREERRKKHMTQAALAAAAGISTSYLNLIEHNKRPIAGALINRIAAALGIAPSRLSDTDNLRLSQDLLEIARTYANLPTTDPEQVLDFVAVAPAWARAILQLHRSYREASETAVALSDRLSQNPALIELSHAVLTRITSIRAFAEILQEHGELDEAARRRFSGIIAAEADALGSSARTMIELLSARPGHAAGSSPEEEVDDFIIYHSNYFPELEEAAGDLRRLLGGGDRIAEAAMAERLENLHKLRIESAEGMAYQAAEASSGADVVRLDPRRREASNRFILARCLAERDHAALLSEIVLGSPLLSSDASRQAARHALANYMASALLFPYERFHEMAEAWRYDIERLAHAFGGSFEQTAHRLVTLRRPGAEGVPFAFLRSDPAGNLSKRFSIPGLRMPRYNGGCALWPLYTAFHSLGRVVTQLAHMPEGEHYLLIAKCVSKHAAGYGEHATLFSIMVGCDAAYMPRIVYGDLFNGSRTRATSTGISCRSCSRTDCPQRAYPPILTSRPR
ncbi:MAG TPA: short-chain fatty acyl-CoA regulator family protein [Ferrovibrio sp.]|uniref:helix-turn-helix domain-containing protein n=1 Tax=Ferrovibrio sp. TaxID=1917215 RepID=UPI002ED141A2